MQERQDKKLSNKRKDKRLSHLEFIRFYLAEKDAPSSALIVDISLGGAQIRTRASCKEQEPCLLLIKRENKDYIEIPGEVRYCEPIPGSDLFGVGIKFLPVTTAQKKDIVNYVHNLFLEKEFLVHEPPA